MSHRVDHAATWLIWPGQDVHPLHHAEILMRQHVAVRHEAADSNWVKVDAKSDRADWVRIDINFGAALLTKYILSIAVGRVCQTVPRMLCSKRTAAERISANIGVTSVGRRSSTNAGKGWFSVRGWRLAG